MEKKWLYDCFRNDTVLLKIFPNNREYYKEILPQESYSFFHYILLGKEINERIEYVYKVLVASFTYC